MTHQTVETKTLPQANCKTKKFEHTNQAFKSDPSSIDLPKIYRTI